MILSKWDNKIKSKGPKREYYTVIFDVRIEKLWVNVLFFNLVVILINAQVFPGGKLHHGSSCYAFIDSEPNGWLEAKVMFDKDNQFSINLHTVPIRPKLTLTPKSTPGLRSRFAWGLLWVYLEIAFGVNWSVLHNFIWVLFFLNKSSLLTLVEVSFIFA